MFNFVILASLSLTACWTSIIGSHPLIQHNHAASHARVYFIRPRGERSMGMADNRLTIMLDQQPLLHLVKGEYTLVLIQPGQTWLSINNQTTFGPAHKIKKETRNQSFVFLAGNTYYINILAVDGEFRGVHFITKALSLSDARKSSQSLRAVGLARKYNISESAL